MDNFRGQKATGTYTYDLKAYTILEMFPYEVFSLDAEMKKTKTAMYVKIRENSTAKKEIIYCSEIKIENV